MGSRFVGKVALIAGGTGGLGRAVALAFLEEQAQVIVTYVKPEEFTGLKTAAGQHASPLEGHAVDVTSPPAVGGLVDNIVAQHGKIDVLVNAVGAYAGGLKLWETATNVFDTMLNLN